MNRFNLTFSGEILQGEKPDAVKLRFAEKFSIDDPDRLERFFSGNEITLRRNLDRKEAAQCFQEMRQIGVVAELVKVSAEEAAADPASDSTVPAKETKPAKQRRGSSTKAPAAKESRKKSSAAPKKARAKKKANPATAVEEAPNESDELLARERSAREEAEARRQAAEREAEQLRAEMDTALRERDAAEEARQAAERAARERAEEETPALRATETEDVEQQEATGQKRLDEERAAREAAERRAEEIRQEQEAARAEVEREAREREEAARLAEAAAREEAAREKARAEEAERTREEEAQRRAEAESARLQAEQERAAAALEAEQREEARRAAEARASRHAQQEVEARRLAEETRALAEEARQRAEALAAQNAALEAERRAAAERAEALEAELVKRNEQARAEVEQQKAHAEQRLAKEQERMAKEEARQARASATREAKLEKQRRDAEAKAAKREAVLAEKARQAEQRLKETQASERRALEAAKRAQEDAREQLLLEEQARAMEEQAVYRAATALSDGLALGPARASTRTSLDVPQRSATGQATRKRQPGEPNFYSLKPFRNTRAVRERAAQAGHTARRLASMGALAVAALAALTGAFLNYSPPPAIGNVTAAAVTPAGGPVLLAGDRLFLHDRSGAPEAEIALATLGVTDLNPPLAFEPGGAMLALGSLDSGDAPQMLRCDLTGEGCTALPDLPDGGEVVAYAGNPVNGDLFLLDTGGTLQKTSATGEIQARAQLPLPERPALRLHAGLLLLNSSTGPALSVLRYDDDAFGQQLDEILLVPPPAVQAKHTRVGDFLFSGGHWWVTLYNPDNGSAGLYRFDSQWNYLDQAALGHPSLPLALTNWGDKTLVNDGRSITLGRFNAGGGVEVPLTSAPLESLAAGSRLRNQLLDSAWRIGLVVLALGALLAFTGAYLQQLRHLVYRNARERGAEPVDDLLDEVVWINESEGREKALRTRLVSYCGLVFAVLLIAVGQRVGVFELAALLLFLLGPGIALALLTRSSAGHIGVTGERLLLVEPAGTYHLGGGGNLLYRGNLLFIDDVALHTGSRLLPAFNEHDVAQRVTPLVEGGVRIDKRTTLTRLLQSQHPLARGLTIIAACSFGALALLAAGAIF